MQKISPRVVSFSQPTIQSHYKKTVLPNGLRIVTEEIPYVRSSSVGVWINVGSRDEDEYNNGISHFFEHMVFKGTKRYTSKQIARSLEAVGGYLNAFTTKEYTCFYARILDDYLNKAIDVLSDLVQHPIFEHKEMEKEKSVILEELKNIEDDPDDLIHDYFDHNIFHTHPLSFPIIGKAENIKNFSRGDLTDFTCRHYVPGRMVISAAGNLRHEKLVEIVERYFRVDNHQQGSFSRLNVNRRFQSKREVFEKPITQAHVCMGTISYSIKSRMRYPLLVLNSLLGEGMSSRLFQNIREKYGFAYDIYSFANLMSDTGSFGVYIGIDNDSIDDAIELVHKELDKLKVKPIGNAELKRTKSQLKGTMMLSLENMSHRMMRLGSGEIYFGEYLSLDHILKSINAVTSDNILDIANKLFQADRFSTVIIKPTSKEAATKKA